MVRDARPALPAVYLTAAPRISTATSSTAITETVSSAPNARLKNVLSGAWRRTSTSAAKLATPRARIICPGEHKKRPTIIGSSFIDVIDLFEEDDQTELIVMCGEIGGDEEEKTAEHIAEHITKPVIGYIAGFTAPPGKRMGHAGAIVSGSSGTAQAKAEALEARGVRVGKNPTEVAQIAAETAGARA